MLEIKYRCDVCGTETANPTVVHVCDVCRRRVCGACLAGHRAAHSEEVSGPD